MKYCINDAALKLEAGRLLGLREHGNTMIEEGGTYLSFKENVFL
jgi:hypothetical protein